MRVVLDTNVILSFLLTRGRTISSIFNAWDEGKFELLISGGIEIINPRQFLLAIGK